MKSKLLMLALALSLASLLTACESDKQDEATAKGAKETATNTQLLSDEELQKKIQDRR
jgi:hypothetical protein